MLTQEWDMGKALDTRFMEGVEQGIERGIKRGVVQGIEQGINQEKMETARRMLASGLAPEEIAEYTALPVEKIRLLQPAAPKSLSSI